MCNSLKFRGKRKRTDVLDDIKYWNFYIYQRNLRQLPYPHDHIVAVEVNVPMSEVVNLKTNKFRIHNLVQSRNVESSRQNEFRQHILSVYNVTY